MAAERRTGVLGVLWAALAGLLGGALVGFAGALLRPRRPGPHERRYAAPRPLERAGDGRTPTAASAP